MRRCLRAAVTSQRLYQRSIGRARIYSTVKPTTHTKPNTMASIAQLKSLQAPFIIDVRTAEERCVHGSLRGSRHAMFVKDDEVASAANLALVTSELSQDTPIVCVCKVGGRAGKMADILRSQGFTSVYNGTSSAFLEANNLPYAKFLPPLHIRQLFDRDSCTYTYIVMDPVSSEALLIDPVIGLVERDLEALAGLNATLVAILNTHVHADHTTGSGRLKAIFRERGDAKVPPSVLSKASGAVADITVSDGDRIDFGEGRFVTVRSVPGHTPGCISYVTDDLKGVFTGDALLVRGCGRTDFQGGDPATLYDSVQNQLFTLPDSTVVWPAHDYSGRTASSIREEKANNPRLTKSKADFVALMEKRFDGSNYPGKIDEALPNNMVCGVFEEPGCWDPKTCTPVKHPDGWTWTPREKA